MNKPPSPGKSGESPMAQKKGKIRRKEMSPLGRQNIIDEQEV
jgi:hypothetical protein